MSKKKRIAEIIRNLPTAEQIRVWNAYCTEDFDDTGYIYDNTPETVNEYCDGKTAWECAEIFYGNDYRTVDDYVQFGIYGAESFDEYGIESRIFPTDVADFCLLEDEDFGVEIIREILDEEENDDA